MPIRATIAFLLLLAGAVGYCGIVCIFRWSLDEFVIGSVALAGAVFLFTCGWRLLNWL